LKNHDNVMLFSQLWYYNYFSFIALVKPFFRTFPFDFKQFYTVLLRSPVSIIYGYFAFFSEAH